jgi:HD-GYP domain-containing protein (c-di-GMP phosphodiesterase class II)
MAAEHYTALLEVLLAVIDARDAETRWHSERATAYALLLGRALGVGTGGMQLLCQGALLHDLGKVGLSTAIFKKPGKLTEIEWEEMRRHPQVGYLMLSDMSFVAEDAMQIVLQHHERWDGQGYPFGLGRDHIHPGARIMAVADALDAMTTARPYRPALPFDQAWEEILSLSGTQFDPGVIDGFSEIGRQYWRRTIELEPRSEPCSEPRSPAAASLCDAQAQPFAMA